MRKIMIIASIFLLPFCVSCAEFLQRPVVKDSYYGGSFTSKMVSDHETENWKKWDKYRSDDEVDVNITVLDLRKSR